MFWNQSNDFIRIIAQNTPFSVRTLKVFQGRPLSQNRPCKTILLQTSHLLRKAMPPPSPSPLLKLSTHLQPCAFSNDHDDIVNTEPIPKLILDCQLCNQQKIFDLSFYFLNLFHCFVFKLIRYLTVYSLSEANTNLRVIDSL